MPEEFKLRVSQQIVDIISNSDYSKIDKADMIFICHNLISYNKSKKISEYNNIIGMSKITNRLINCKTDRAKELLKNLQDLSIIVYKNDKKNYINMSQNVSEAQIDSNFHFKTSWYTFKEENELTERLFKTYTKKKKSKIKDNLITLKNTDKFKSDEVAMKQSQKFLEIIELRNLGIDIDSETFSSSNSRYYNIYSNLMKKYRNELTDVYGNKLFEIDFSSSQFSILISEMKKSSINSGTIELKEELNKLTEIIASTGMYEKFVDICNEENEYITRGIAKVLLLKFLFSHPGNRSKNLFSKELSETAIEENVDLEKCWQIINEHFQEEFPNFLKYLNGMHRNQLKGNSNLAIFLQRKEAKILKTIIRKFKSIIDSDFNFFTIHDAIFCISKFKRQVTKIVHDVLNKLNQTEMLTMKYKKVDHNSKIENPRNLTLMKNLSHYVGIFELLKFKSNAWEINEENQELLKMEIDLLQIE